MGEIVKSLKSKNIITGYLFFYVHFVVEVICFYVLSNYAKDLSFVWLVPFVYDALAFIPQSIIGYFSDKFPRVQLGLIGLFLLLGGFISYCLNFGSIYLSLVFLCLGNACLHVEGAEVTLRTSNGKLSHSAIFVSGGSFGVITGKLLGTSSLSFIFLVLLGLTTIPFILLADEYKKDTLENNKACYDFDYANKDISGELLIILAVVVVIIRGYMGYGLPTSWNKTIFQTILLYLAMGLGKALGGILSDSFGVKKIGILSCVLSLPFLLFGDNLMVVSLIGVMFFSMTMSITLALIVSVLKEAPGLSFGMTTIGLFLGTAPIFFIKTSTIVNYFVITIFTLLCIIIFRKIIREDKK